MRTRTLLLVVLAALAPGLGAAQAVTHYVDDDNCPGPGSGTVGDPFCAIQAAVVAAADGDTVRVMPGTYTECVDNLTATIGSLKGLDLVADAYLASGDSTVTIIDGQVDLDSDGVGDGDSDGIGDGCPDPLDATVNIAGSPASPSSLEGFTITGGAVSGIFVRGEVRITHNLIAGNSGDLGGGIYVDGGACEYGDTTVDVVENDVNGNSAASSGGGIYVVTPSVTAVGCSGTRADVNIDNNAIDSNEAVSGSGGGLVVLAQSFSNEQTVVTITQNDIGNNSIPLGATFGYGGGVYLTTFGEGTETIRFNNNNVAANEAAADGGGVSVFIDLLTQGDHNIELDGNNVSGNVAGGNGGGLDLFVVADGVSAGHGLSVVATNNVVGPNNQSFGNQGGGGGILATFLSLRSDSPDMEFRVNDNEVVDNLASITGGGISLWSSADADPDQDGNTSPAASHIEVAGNRISSNDASGGAAVGGGIFAYVEAYGDGVATADLLFNTIHDNTTDFDGGGIHMESFTDVDFNGNDAGQRAELTIDSSIIADNVGYGIGGLPGGGTARFVSTIDYNDVFGNSLGGFQTPAFPGPSGIAEDPLLDASGRPAFCSPTIDAADPTVDFSAEPPYNGGRANMGHTGGTALATPSLPDLNSDGLVDGFEVVNLSAAFGATDGQPRFNALVNVDPTPDAGSGLQIVDGDDLAIVAARFGQSCP